MHEELAFDPSMDEPDEARAGPPAFEHFLSEGLITSVIRPVKSGKEASVFLCRGNRSNTGVDLLAAKVFHARERRGFRNNHAYRQGQLIGKHREQRAVRTKTEFGREVEEGWWRHREFATLQTLHGAGADVPEVSSNGGNGHQNPNGSTRPGAQWNFFHRGRGGSVAFEVVAPGLRLI